MQAFQTQPAPTRLRYQRCHLRARPLRKMWELSWAPLWAAFWASPCLASSYIMFCSVEGTTSASRTVRPRRNQPRPRPSGVPRHARTQTGPCRFCPHIRCRYTTQMTRVPSLHLQPPGRRRPSHLALLPRGWVRPLSDTCARSA
ncbi:hypothetical protein K466DRAFT_265202 [Polyporus arcularius HHB13444]|uniref:Uncharacterized protein n=1 Tax=Polyporus arcularius HHB13444 TaxID=1314778 RepID=A0A5C3P149_9APHY|nr:hypothetical protein K466DRAFT_265202 [Polyporus arcularius HHB13444]